MAKILIVDDDEDVLITLLLALKCEGHEVMEARNGIEADELLAQNTFDLVITDIIMPEKEGLELIMSINKDFPHVKIIAITGGGMDGDDKLYLDDAAMFGADDTLQKPFDANALLQSVEDCLLGKTKRSNFGTL